MENLNCFEVETQYKSGRKRVEVVVSRDFESFWQYYYKHHNINLIETSTLLDTWAA